MKRAFVLVCTGALLATGVWWVGSDYIRRAWAELIPPPSPHVRYTRALQAAGLHDSALGRAWLASGAAALAAPQRRSLPFTATISFDEAIPAAAGWAFTAQRGRRLELEVEHDSGHAVFVDLYKIDDGEPRLVESAGDDERTLSYEPLDTGSFVLRVQPELLAGGSVTVRQHAVATLRFPVAGASIRAVQSVFGDERDRGARSHEGIDIFAPRGTPVVAASDGWITRVATNRLGGKVVWQWDAARGHALYYAHLDSQEVSPGTHVTAGDIVGRVGNTGNAAKTPAHLHFGIYRPIEGAVDPLPFICDAPCPRGMAYAHQR